METSRMKGTEEERGGKSETENFSEAGTLEEKEPESLRQRLKTLKGFTDMTEQDPGGGCIIVGYHQKPKEKPEE